MVWPKLAQAVRWFPAFLSFASRYPAVVPAQSFGAYFVTFCLASVSSRVVVNVTPPSLG